MSNTEHIRNIGIIAHVDAGKTTITEQFLFLAGVTRSVGRVDEGTARTDFLDIERRRGISVRAATVSFTYRDMQINLIDTPGHSDFIAEVERSLRVLDGVILVLSAVEGVEAQAEALFNAARNLGLPAIAFINKTDRLGADTAAVLAELRETWHGITFIDIESDEAVVQIAELDEALTEKFLADDSISPAELQAVLRRVTLAGTAVPVLCGSALKGEGIAELLMSVIDYLPAPPDRSAEDFSALVFRIEHGDPMGRSAYVRLYGGNLQNRDLVSVHGNNSQGRVSQIRRPQAGRSSDIGKVECGDIAILLGLGEVRVGDVLGNGEGLPKEYAIAEPLMRVRVEPKVLGGHADLLKALRELVEEDPLLALDVYTPGQSELQMGRNSMVAVSPNSEISLRLMGSMQQESIEALLQERYGIVAHFGEPTVVFKETLANAGEGYDAYTMPKPCWAVLRVAMEPLPQGSGFVYDPGYVRNEKLLQRYQDHICRAIPEALKQGLYGWEVTDLKVTLLDGEHHKFHTHPMDFFVVTPLAIRDGLRNCGTRLLEPALKARVMVPDEYAGRITQDFVSRRGNITDSGLTRGRFTLEGIIPLQAALDYSTWLLMNTRGQAVLSVVSAGYQPCPPELGKSTPYRGVDPLDRSRYILAVRKALDG